VQRTANQRELKKAYRKLGQQYHPDKNKAENATVIFRKIAKAYEVLENNKSRESFDYYLRNPTDYFKVSGEHYYRALPKASVTNVLIGAIILASIFLHVVQQSKHARAKRFLLDRVSRGANEMTGGTKQTMALFAQAQEQYIKYLEAKLVANASNTNASTGSGGSSPREISKMEKKQAAKLQKSGGMKVNVVEMLKDPEFNQITVKVGLFPSFFSLFIFSAYIS
jgi:hypothetical protein